jgi:hypothetical protein
LAHALQVTGLGHDPAGIAEDRSGDHPCDLVPVSAQSFRKQVGVIPGQYNQGFSQYFGNTVRIWNRVGSDASTCGFKRRVVALVSLIRPTMIMPFEAHD